MPGIRLAGLKATCSFSLNMEVMGRSSTSLPICLSGNSSSGQVCRQGGQVSRQHGSQAGALAATGRHMHEGEIRDQLQAQRMHTLVASSGSKL